MLSASQWTSRNLIENCIGPSGAIGPPGPIGPSGPKGAKGPTGFIGKQGLDGTTGLTGNTGETGIIGLERSLRIQYTTLDSVNFINVLNLSSNDKYTTFIIYNYNNISPSRLLDIQSTGDIELYDETDFWIRLKCINVASNPIQIGIIVNNVETTITLPGLTTSITPGRIFYVYWNGSGLVLY